jgi:hypothetical protein
MRFVHTETGQARQWGHLGLLVAFTAGIWCLAVGFEAPEDSELCAWDRDDAQIKCGTSCVQQLAIINPGIAGSYEYHTPRWMSAPVAVSPATADALASTASLPVLAAHFGPHASPAGPLYRIAPKQSPPTSALG